MWLENNQQPSGELTLDEIATVAKRISKAPGASGITITGGEPLLREDITDVVRVCRDSGLKVAIATNGTLLTKSLIHRLVSNGIQHFDIGFTEPARQVRLALSEAAKTGCTVSASVCIHRLNYTKTGILTETAAALGADSVVLNRFVPTGRGKENREILQLSNSRLLHALKLANTAAVSSGIFVYTGIPIEPCVAEPGLFPGITFSTCQCGEVKWAIDPHGNLRTCEQNKETLGSLLENSFAEILGSNSLKIDEFRDWRRFDNCFSCKLPGNCTGGCRFR